MPRLIGHVENIAVKTNTDIKMIENGIESLSEYVKANNLDKIKQIFQANQNGNWRNNSIVKNAMRDAILLGQVETVRFFLDSGVSANAYVDIYISGRYEATRSLIYFAAKKGHLAIVNLLMEYHADIKPRNSNYQRGDNSAIEGALEGGHVILVEFLLQRGAEVNGMLGDSIAITSICPITYLGYSALEENDGMASSLIDHGANIKGAIECNYRHLSDTVKKYNEYIECATDDKSKLEVQEKIHETQKKQLPSTRFLMDYAMGLDLTNHDKFDKDNMRYFNDVNVSGVNFIGVSLDGKPITKDVLVLNKIQGAEKAITSLADIDQLFKVDKTADIKRFKVLNNNIEKAFKKYGKLVDSKGIVNLVPLHKAAEIGDISAVKSRLSAGIDPNQDKTIIIAAKMGHMEIVKFLAADQKFDKSLLPDAIAEAKSADRKNIVDYLESLIDVNQLGSDGKTLLHRAVDAGTVSEVKKLIALGANVNIQDECGATPLYNAASQSFDSRYDLKPSQKHIDIITILLEHKADANILCHSMTPLYAAARAGSSKAVELLLPVTHKNPVPVNHHHSSTVVRYKPWYVDVLFESEKSPEREQIFALLKASGADFSTHNYCFDRYTLLHMAMEELQFVDKNQANFIRCLEYVVLLLSYGASPVCRDVDGGTPLHRFMLKAKLDQMDGAYEKVIDVCMKKGFDINAKDKNGATILHIAASREKHKAVQCLLDRKADINVVDDEKRTPLHYAAAGAPKATALLIKRGANYKALDAKGMTPSAYSSYQLEQEFKTLTFSKKEYQDEFVKPYEDAQSILSEVQSADEKNNSVTPMDDIKCASSPAKNGLFSPVGLFPGTKQVDTKSSGAVSVLSDSKHPKGSHCVIQ